MAVVYIKEHNECIYDMFQELGKIDSSKVQCEKYESKFRAKIQRELNELKKPHRTMGLAKVPLESPKRYLRRKPHKVWPEKCTTVTYKEHKKPPVPKYCKTDTENVCCCEKNFIAKNIIEISKRQTKKPLLRYVDTCRGNVLNVEEPVYVHLSSFGKTPKYLERRKREIQENECKEVADVDKDTRRFISDEKRMEIVNGLKQTRDVLMKEFLLLPMLTDTIPKILRKSKLEKQLDQLDKDINMVEGYSKIVVSN